MKFKTLKTNVDSKVSWVEAYKMKWQHPKMYGEENEDGSVTQSRSRLHIIPKKDNDGKLLGITFPQLNLFISIWNADLIVN